MELLATKLFIPQPKPGLVSRPRLIARLDAILTNLLTLVSAPAGYGKTTVLSQWISQNKSQLKVFWVQLDDNDNDPVRFWDYVVEALKKEQPTVGQITSSMLHAPQQIPIEAILTPLINDLSQITENAVLVLDDYHLIKTDAVHTGVAFLIDHIPPNFHLVISTRIDPPLPLSRFRGRGTLLELSVRDLKFTVNESAEFLKQETDAELSSEDNLALNIRSEGWAVGIKMAAMAMRGRKDIHQFVNSYTGSQRYVMDYLIEEVIKRQSEDVRNFLFNTAILQKMTPSLCNAVTGHADGWDMLMKLEKANLFLVQLDDSREWFRYHHLFADLLHHQLSLNISIAEIKKLHTVASEWYAENHFPDEAIFHAIESKDWQRCLTLLYPECEKRNNRGEIQTVVNWLQRIPETVLRSHPTIYIKYCSAMVYSGEVETANTTLHYLEQMALDDNALQGEVASLYAALADRSGDVPSLVEHAQKALKLLPETKYEARSRAYWELGLISYVQGRLDEAIQLLSNSYEAAKQANNTWMGANALGFAARSLWMKGEIQLSIEIARKAVEMGGQSPAAASPL
jgi:LuxR family transcriptional regulator, maltose regulon positive regulatory protein